MKIKRLNCAIICLLAIGCNNGQKNNSETTQGEIPEAGSSINCYRYANAGDTVILRLIHRGEAITGTLVYRWKEKDGNKGTIQGKMHGDLLVANYTFMSEGVNSVRQVAFREGKGFFVEGYGEVLNKNDKVVFTHLDSLKFNEAMKLVAVECSE